MKVGMVRREMISPWRAELMPRWRRRSERHPAMMPLTRTAMGAMRRPKIEGRSEASVAAGSIGIRGSAASTSCMWSKVSCAAPTLGAMKLAEDGAPGFVVSRGRRSFASANDTPPYRKVRERVGHPDFWWDEIRGEVRFWVGRGLWWLRWGRRGWWPSLRWGSPWGRGGWRLRGIWLFRWRR